MVVSILVASSALAVALVYALMREMRLRRALERLVVRLWKLWRQEHESDL